MSRGPTRIWWTHNVRNPPPKKCVHTKNSDEKLILMLHFLSDVFNDTVPGYLSWFLLQDKSRWRDDLTSSVFQQLVVYFLICSVKMYSWMCCQCCVAALQAAAGCVRELDFTAAHWCCDFLNSCLMQFTCITAAFSRLGSHYVRPYL